MLIVITLFSVSYNAVTAEAALRLLKVKVISVARIIAISNYRLNCVKNIVVCFCAAVSIGRNTCCVRLPV